MPKPRIPKELKLLKGTFRPTESVEQEPEYEATDMEPPDSLEGEALLLWEKLVPLMSEARVLKDTDLVALEQYCQTYAIWKRAQQGVQESGTSVFNPGKDGSSGYYTKNPDCTVMKETSVELRGLSALLGLDPASRTRINVGKSDKDEKKTFGALRPASR